MNFAPERIAKIVARQGAALKARPEMKRHLAGDDIHVVIPGCASGAGPNPCPIGMIPGSSLRDARNDGSDCLTTAAAVAIGLRCASAATVEVPIGPCSS